jgi:predicted N-acetyltransferase YhbS
MEYKLNVREIRESDINFIADYWSTATPEYLLNMGVDLKKMPARSDFQTMLSNQIKLDYEHKKSFALIWEVDGKPVGHSNVNPVEYGNQAFMHLHMVS